MSEEYHKAMNSYSVIILLTLIGLVALPFVLIGLAVLEGNLFGTAYLQDIGRFLGIYEPLAALHDALEPILGW